MVSRRRAARPGRSHTLPAAKILKADPDVEIPWQEIETDLWIAECVCGKEYHREPLADGRVRLDPLDPSTARHAPQCEHAHTTDAAVLRLVLNVKDGLEPGYWWVTCLACHASWQVLHHGVESGE